MHSGTGEGGHYYSFIKDKCSTGPRWLEFNDRVVKLFDESKIPEECYGGQETVQRFTESSGWSEYETEDVEKSRSAYLLLYERKPKNQKTTTSGTKLRSSPLEDKINLGEESK